MKTMTTAEWLAARPVHKDGPDEHHHHWWQTNVGWDSVLFHRLSDPDHLMMHVDYEGLTTEQAPPCVDESCLLHQYKVPEATDV